jgi:putative flippase GtrA
MSVGNVDLSGHAPVGARAVFARLLSLLPRPLRFLVVGGVGLLVDLSVFTLIAEHGAHPLIARVGSLAVATLLTWRLNRAFTFAHSGRHPGEEAMRCIAVAMVAQATSYAVFAALVLTVAGGLAQAAVVAGAAAGALISYGGYRLFAFAPRKQSQPKARL